MRHSLIAALVVVLASCTESTPIEPTQQPAEAFKLAAASVTNQTIVAGGSVAQLPAVLATDAAGKPVSGVAVTFVVNSGMSRMTALTDMNGLATITPWATSTHAGVDDVVIASVTGLDPIKFVVQIIPGPAAQLVSLLTDEQLGFAGGVLPQSPAVRVVDKYGNPVANEVVTFEAVLGTSIANPPTVTTDSTGTARTQWMLGVEETQVLSATLRTLPQVLFRARAFSVSDSCGSLVRLPASGQIESSLGNPACQANGKFQQTLVIDVSGPMAWRFNMGSNAFRTAIELRDMKGLVIGRSDNLPSSSATVRAILPSGLYQLILTSADPNASGAFTLQFNTISTSANCGDVFVTRGLTLAQQSQSICPTHPSTRTVDSYLLNLEAGASVNVKLDDWSYDDPSIELRNDKGEVVAVGKQNGFYIDVLDFVPTVGGTYTIVVTAGQEELIQYSLTIN